MAFQGSGLSILEGGRLTVAIRPGRACVMPWPSPGLAPRRC